jgi:rhamnulose-1-phosphate aldolase
MLISGTGTRFRDIADNPVSGMCVIRITNDGKAYQFYSMSASSGQIKPTSELATHLKLHDYLVRTKSSNSVVLHTHPTELVALTHIRKFWNEGVFNGIILGMLPEVKVILPEGAGLVDYALPGSVRLADTTLQKLSEGFRTILWPGRIR